MTNVDTSTSMESPLHHRVAHTNAANAGVVMKEDKFRGQLNLRGNPQDAAFTSAVEKVLGVALPMAPSSSVRNGDTVVYWLCPNEWLLIVASGTQGQVEAADRVRNMVKQMDEEGFGNCTNTGACEVECPKGISLENIARMNREYLKASII